MTWAVNHPQQGHAVRGRWEPSAEAAAASRASSRPIRLPLVGLLITLVGAWGAVVAFVGPTFGFPVTSTTAWDWTITNWFLHLVPGGMAFVAGLLILLWMSRTGSFRARGLLGLAAVVTVVAGGWFVIGPALWPTFETSAAFTPAPDVQTGFYYQAAANLGPGVILAMLGGMALKTAFSARRWVGGADFGGSPAYDGQPPTNRAAFSGPPPYDRAAYSDSDVTGTYPVAGGAAAPAGGGPAAGGAGFAGGGAGPAAGGGAAGGGAEPAGWTGWGGGDPGADPTAQGQGTVGAPGAAGTGPVDPDGPLVPPDVQPGAGETPAGGEMSAGEAPTGETPARGASTGTGGDPPAATGAAE